MVSIQSKQVCQEWAKKKKKFKIQMCKADRLAAVITAKGGLSIEAGDWKRKQPKFFLFNQSQFFLPEIVWFIV